MAETVTSDVYQMEVTNYEEIYDYFISRQEELEDRQLQTHFVTENGAIRIKHEMTVGEATLSLVLILFMVFQFLKYIISTIWRR